MQKWKKETYDFGFVEVFGRGLLLGRQFVQCGQVANAGEGARPNKTDRQHLFFSSAPTTKGKKIDPQWKSQTRLASIGYCKYRIARWRPSIFIQDNSPLRDFLHLRARWRWECDLRKHLHCQHFGSFHFSAIPFSFFGILFVFIADQFQYDLE